MIKLTSLVVVGILLSAHTQVWAATADLPLSSKEINQLQHLFSSSTPDTVPHFSVELPHEHRVWQQTPIDVVLPIGKERVVTFPTAVEFGYDKNVLSDAALRVQNNNGTLYLLAKTAFTTQRVQVRCQNTGNIILLNLSAQKEASNTPLDIVMPLPSATQLSHVNLVTPDTKSSAITYLTLTRFAAQQLYAPKRLLVQPANIYRTPMHTSKTIPLFHDGAVVAMPLASWRGGDLTVTAVLVRNQSSQAVTLDPRAICGDWRAASFFPHTVLTPAGERADSTTLFLIANRAFSDAMASCQRGF